MKIFSSFDTDLKKKKLQNQYDKYGKDKVHIIKRSKLFLFVKVLTPIMQWLLFTLLLAGLIWYMFASENSLYISIIGWTLLSLIFYISAFGAYIDYTMDYCIITPDEIILTQQEWLFRRIVRTLDVKKLKSIYINKQKLLYSIFDAWSIIFMSDWDEQFWEIIFDFVHNPEWQKDRIQGIISSNQYWEE